MPIKSLGRHARSDGFLPHFVAYNEIATLNVGGRARIRNAASFRATHSPNPIFGSGGRKTFLGTFQLILVTNMAVDIRRMGKAELDELNKSAREWRERKKPAQAVTDAIPEPSQADIADPRETKIRRQRSASKSNFYETECRRWTKVLGATERNPEFWVTYVPMFPKPQHAEKLA